MIKASNGSGTRIKSLLFVKKSHKILFKFWHPVNCLLTEFVSILFEKLIISGFQNWFICKNSPRIKRSGIFLINFVLKMSFADKMAELPHVFSIFFPFLNIFLFLMIFSNFKNYSGGYLIDSQKNMLYSPLLLYSLEIFQTWIKWLLLDSHC